jgi:hypothetical protein
MKKLASVVGIALTLTSIAVPTAFARAIAAAAGMATALGSAGEFAWLTTGVMAPSATAASPRNFVIPVGLDSAGNKTFIIKGPEDVVLDEVACGDTLCRIRVEHGSDEARQWFSDALGDERFGSGSFVQQTDEGLASVAYGGRKGVDFRIPTALNLR